MVLLSVVRPFCVCTTDGRNCSDSRLKVSFISVVETCSLLQDNLVIDLA